MKWIFKISSFSRGIVTDEYRVQMQQPERYNNTIQTAHLVSQSIGNNDNKYYDKEVRHTILHTVEWLIHWIKKNSSLQLHPNLINSGIYRQRSYDNLQNGKSPVPIRPTTFYRNRSRSASDYTVGLSFVHETLSNQISNVPVPTHFKYFSPQRKCSDPNIMPRYPYHKNRAVPRQRPWEPINRNIIDRQVIVDLKSPGLPDLFDILDFNDPSEIDPMLRIRDRDHYYKNKRYSNHYVPSPAKRKQRYSNVYEYSTMSYGLGGLNSIVESSSSEESS